MGYQITKENKERLKLGLPVIKHAIIEKNQTVGEKWAQRFVFCSLFSNLFSFFFAKKTKTKYSHISHIDMTDYIYTHPKF